MDVVIDLLGRAVLAGKRDVAVAVSKIGVVHIRTVGKTAIVTFAPEAASRTSLAGAFYKIADFNPERTIVVAGIGNSAFWIYPGYAAALRKIDELVSTKANLEFGIAGAVVEHSL